MARALLWALAALAVAIAGMDVPSGSWVEILEPAEGSDVSPGPLLVRFRVLPDGIPAAGPGEGGSARTVAVAVHVDGVRMAVVRMAACRKGSPAGDCLASTSVQLDGRGEGGKGDEEDKFRTVTMLLLVPDEGAGDDPGEDYDKAWDVAGEASVTVDIVDGGGGGAVGDSLRGEHPSALGRRGPSASHQAGSSSAGLPVIVFDSPTARRQSFLDPNNVTLRFHLVENDSAADRGGAQGHHAEVLVDGAVVASGFAGPSLEVTMPAMAAKQYTLEVFLTDEDGARTGVSAEMQFFVWPDHSWVRKIEAHGDGLTLARAGAVSTFRITSRDRHGNPTPPGSDSYFCRLSGPARVGCSVRHVMREVYEASYMVAENGTYNLEVELHYAGGGGLLDYGAEGGGGNDVIAWPIRGSPFSVSLGGGGWRVGVHPYVNVPLCSEVGGGLGGSGPVLGGRWVPRALCEGGTWDCGGMAEEDDTMVWLPWHCRHRRINADALRVCARARGGFRILIAGSSQQRTLFFDVAKMLGSKMVQPRKYWTDLAADDVNPSLFFHWMVPGYSDDGTLDYDALLADLEEFVKEHSRGPMDVVVVQASVHDLHLGTLGEYGGHVGRVAALLAGLGVRAVFRSGDAFHVPPGTRFIVERGMRDPRMQAANALAERAMAERRVPYVDTHLSTVGRPDKSLDGYHYFDRFTEEVSEEGGEICQGNSVARTQAQVLLNFVCPGAGGGKGEL